MTALLWVSSATAHDVPVERTIIAQVHSDRLEFLLVYEESPGVRTEQFVAKYDFNGNGRIDGKEVALATPELTRRALLGLEFEVPGERPAMLPAEAKFRRKPGKGLSAALFLTFRLPPIEAARSVKIRLKPSKGLPRTTVTIDAGDGFMIASSDGAEANDQGTRPVVLKAGEYLSAIVRPRDTAASQ